MGPLKLITNIILFLLCSTFISSAFAIPIKTAAFGNINYAHVDGFVQTPKGGSFGTTNMGRPDFDELDIAHDKFYSFGLEVTVCDYFGLLEYSHFDPHGSTILTQELITHSQLIPAGHSFDMNLEFDWYALGIGKNFFWNQTWTVSPQILLSWVKYHYEFQAPPIESARNFSLIGANIGLKLAHYFTPQLSADVKALIPLPLSNIHIIDVDAGLGLDIASSSHVTVIPRLAIGWLQLEYKDEQPIPNYIRYRASPYGSFELKVLFD